LPPLPRRPRLILLVLTPVLLAVVLATWLWLSRPAVPLETALPTGPQNVVFVIADDMRLDGLQAMPRLLSLAERGVTFENFFVPTPTCCPSRATMLTGLYTRHHGVLGNHPPMGGVTRFDDRATLATWLHFGGVRTGLIGRYLNGYEKTTVPPGWDTFYAMWGGDSGANNYYNYTVTDNGRRRRIGKDPDDYSTRVLTRKAIEFIEADDGRPFFLMVTPRTPHGPYTPDPRDIGAYREAQLAPLPAFDEEDVSDKRGFTASLPRLTPEEYQKTDQDRRKILEALYGLDRGIGEIVDALRAGGQLDKTWIIFTSDNGRMLGEHRWFQRKSCPYEECIHLPLIVVPPGGFERPRVESRLTASIDLVPTISEIFQVKPDLQPDGTSLLPLLRGQDVAWRDGVVIEVWDQDEPEDDEEREAAQKRPSGDPFQGIRTANRKFFRLPSGEEELYDLQADPFELDNLADSPAWGDEKARLSKQLDALLSAPSPYPGASWPG
jgi:arylsulfatase A-like enzyme